MTVVFLCTLPLPPNVNVSLKPVRLPRGAPAEDLGPGALNLRGRTSTMRGTSTTERYHLRSMTMLRSIL
jgi:hypothetical protein